MSESELPYNDDSKLYKDRVCFQTPSDYGVKQDQPKIYKLFHSGGSSGGGCGIVRDWRCQQVVVVDMVTLVIRMGWLLYLAEVRVMLVSGSDSNVESFGGAGGKEDDGGCPLSS